jgi:hypothetical protein
LESYYFSRVDKEGIDGMPFLGHTLSITGIPLARIDRTSVFIAYLRGICGALMIIGFIGSIFMAIPLLMGPHGMAVDPVKTLYGALGLFALGVAVGALTYVLPLTTRRERRIRMYCGELLGFCADPARVRADLAAEMWQEQVQGATAVDMTEAAMSRLNYLLQLIQARCEIAHGQRVEQMEQTTDEVLERLRQCDGADRSSTASGAL